MREEVQESKGQGFPRTQGPKYLKVTFKYELDSKEGPSCYELCLILVFIIVFYCAALPSINKMKQRSQEQQQDALSL